MNALVERIKKEGQNLGGGILKVDGFINHQVDPILMDECGREFASRFKGINANKILTAEISGSLRLWPQPGTWNCLLSMPENANR